MKTIAEIHDLLKVATNTDYDTAAGSRRNTAKNEIAKAFVEAQTEAAEAPILRELLAEKARLTATLQFELDTARAANTLKPPVPSSPLSMLDFTGLDNPKLTKLIRDELTNETHPPLTVPQITKLIHLFNNMALQHKEATQ